MKQFQIVIRNTNTKDNGNILYKGVLYSKDTLRSKDMGELPEDAGYDTIGAAKRIATMINKDPKYAGMDGMIDIEAHVTTAEEIKMLDKNKELARELMEQYYPEQEAKIKDAAERAKAEAAVGAPLTDEEWNAAKSASAQPVTKTPKTPKAPKAPKPAADPYRLTDKQLFFLDNMRYDCFYEHGMESALWVDVLVDTFSDMAGGGMNPMTCGAMVSTLRERGILSVGYDKREKKTVKFITLTELGKEVMKYHGLDKPIKHTSTTVTDTSK